MTAGRRRARGAVLAALACAAMLAAGCGAPGPGQNGGSRSPSASPSSASPSSASPSSASPSPPGCAVTAPGFPCVMQARIAAVRRYLSGQPGVSGVVLHDRVTGATWRNSSARRDFPAASTMKLAMAADLLERHAAGMITLTAADIALIHSALRASSDAAADRLWHAFENGSFLTRIRAYGMTSASFTTSPYWGSMTCSPRDLSNLMNYVLTRLPPRDRALIVTDLREVAPNQRWGVWGAGAANRPGNKNGWVEINGVWTVATVGFAGPRERYTLAVMDHLRGEAGFTEGATTLTEVAALLLRGHRVPAPRVTATP